MKKVIIFVGIIALLIISAVFANSYVQALSKEERLQVKKEILEQRVEENKITEEQANQIYKNMEENMTNCDDICPQNEDCQINQQDGNCRKLNNQCVQQHDNHMRKCGRGQNRHNRMCNR